MRTLSSAIGALGFACAASAGTLPLPSDFESVRIIKVWEPSGQRLAPPIGTVVADFNRDSKPDIVSLTADESFIALGDGSGGFASPITLPFRGSALATADFNDDSNPDLAFTSPAGVYVAQGGGNAAFAPAALVFAATNPTAIAVGDFNADTLSDLVWRDDTGVHVAIRTGPSSFTSPSFVTTTPGDLIVGPIDAVPGDDLAIGAAVFYARPGAPFESGPTLPTDRIAAVADMDADADADLIVESIGPAPSFAASLAIARNDSGAFTLEPATPLNDPGPHHLTIADFDASGTLDAAAASSRSYLQSSSVTVGRRVIVLLNQDGALHFQSALMSGGAVTDTLTAADLDADDRPDLVVSNRGARFGYTATGETYRYGRSVSALLNGPNADFRAPQVLRAGGFSLDGPCVAWDIDNDADNDLVTSGTSGSSSSVRIKRNLGNGRFSDLDVYVSFPSVPPPRLIPRIRDWNADGDLDLTLGEYDVRLDPEILPPEGYEPGIALRATPIPPTPPLPPPASQFARTIYADFDGDGVEDLLQYSGNSVIHTPGMRILLRRGEAFADPIVFFSGQRVEAVATGQFDNQPGMDLAVAIRGSFDNAAHVGRNYTFALLTNTGVGQYTQSPELPIGDAVDQLSKHDLWNDFFASGGGLLRRITKGTGNTWNVVPVGLNDVPAGQPILDANGDSSVDVLAVRSLGFVDSSATLFAFARTSWVLQLLPVDVASLPWTVAQSTPARLNPDSQDDLVLRDGRFADIWVLRRPLPPVPPVCLADTNQDRRIDGRDLNNIIQSIRFQTPVTPDCDLNHDSLVDGRDLSILLARFGTSCPSNPAP